MGRRVWVSASRRRIIVDDNEVETVAFLSIFLLGPRCSGHKDDFDTFKYVCRHVGRSLLYCQGCAECHQGTLIRGF